MNKSAVFDFIVVGGGIVGTSIAYHLARHRSATVLLIERDQIAAGCTARSSAIIRSHYSIPANSALAWRTIGILSGFQEYLQDGEAESGFQGKGYIILGGARDAQAMRHNVSMQQGLGVDTRTIPLDEVARLHPYLRLDDVGVAAYEPRSGWADPYLTTRSFYRAGKRLGMVSRLNSPVSRLLARGRRIEGVEVDGEKIFAGHVVTALNVWSNDILRSIDVRLPLAAEKHRLASYRIEEDYPSDLPVVKDLLSDNKMYFRPATGNIVLTGGGEAGDVVADPDAYDEGVGLDYIAEQGGRLAHRLPQFAQAMHVHDWSGLYDVSPDWNPIIGAVGGYAGLTVACGFSGHGFKLAPALGEALAAGLLGEPAARSLECYAPARFQAGQLLQGAYGVGSIS